MRDVLRFSWSKRFDFEFIEFGKDRNHCGIWNAEKDASANPDERPTKAFEHGLTFQIAI